MFSQGSRQFITAFALSALLSGCSSCTSSSLNSSTPSVGAAPSKSRTSQTQFILVGKVVRILDGDTIDVLDNGSNRHRVRLKGIDAPEQQQAFSMRAKENLVSMLANKEVTVEWNKRDDRNRLIGKVLLNGRDVCLDQVQAGLAWHFKRYQNEQSEEDRELYDTAELEARSVKTGLWQHPSPLEPWIFRERQRHHSPISSDQDNNSGNGITTTAPSSETEIIRGNKRSMVYHWPGCPDYEKIAPHNRVPFRSHEEAERAAYRAARNCPNAP